MPAARPSGESFPDLVAGRWWASSGEPWEVDVLGLRGDRTHLLGEARWQESPLDTRDLEALRRKATCVQRLVEASLYALWGGVGSDLKYGGPVHRGSTWKPPWMLEQVSFALEVLAPIYLHSRWAHQSRVTADCQFDSQLA